MTTVVNNPQIVPRPPASLPALRAADEGVRQRPGVRPLRQYPARLRRPVASLRRMVQRRRSPLPCWRKPLTVARYMAARANSGASIATLRLATSAITKAHEWAGHESP